MDFIVHNARSSEYYLRVVPMHYENERAGKTFDSFEYVSSSNEVVGRYQIPAAYFRWDYSPITVKYTIRARSFTHFLVQVCINFLHMCRSKE